MLSDRRQSQPVHQGFMFVLGSFACFAVLSGATSQAQETQQGPWAERMFDRLNQDFGVVASGSTAKARIKITSLWRDDTHIASVRTTCGCSAAKPGKTTLKSRESTFIEITMDTHKFSHRKDSNVIVTFDAPKHAEVRIPITAYIQPDIVLNPGSVNFGAVDSGTAWKQKIHVSHSSRPDWRIKGATTANKHLNVSVARSNRGPSDYELSVTLKPTAPIGEFRDHVVLKTGDGPSSRLTVLVQGKIDPDVIVTPAAASVGMLQPGQQKTIRVVVRGKRAIEIEQITSATEQSSCAWKTPTRKQNVHVIPITIKADGKTGKIVEEFDITIAGRPEPVHFKVSGQVAEVD